MCTTSSIYADNEKMAEKKPEDIKCHRQLRYCAVKHKSPILTLTPAERSVRYRDSIKKNPRKYLEYKAKESDRKKQSWKNRSEEQIIEDRKKARERQQKYRDRRKAMGMKSSSEKNCSKQVLTRTEREKQRAYWRKKQAESRLKRTAQKQRRKKEKDRHYRQEKRILPTLRLVKSTLRRPSLPKNPEEFVTALQTVVNTATPRKRELLRKNQLLNTPTSRKKLKFFEKSAGIVQEVLKGHSLFKKTIVRKLAFLKKYRLNRMMSTYLGVQDSFISKHASTSEGPKQPRKDATSEKDKTMMEEFFQRAVSTIS